MSSISNTPRRPSTAHATTLNTRMPYEAGEALLWERQNARANTHLFTQMKALQSAHDAYDARIAAAEAVAEAAEAALGTVRALERKVDALEADEREGPFVAWVKEAVGQLQGSVEGLKGVRRKVCEVEREVERLGEKVDGGVVRRLEALESERREEGRRFRESEVMVERLSEGGPVDREVVRETYGEAQVDDSPLAVFYGIETQSPARHQDSPARRQDNGQSNPAIPPPDRLPARLAESPHRLDHCPQPREESTARLEDASPNLFKVASEIDYGWESTQQFKDMRKELEALRAMCRTQEPKGSNQTADATQRPPETLIVGSANNADFSDATTELDAELDGDNIQVFFSPTRGLEGTSSSTFQQPSSPLKRVEIQSARRNLMKRRSIRDPRVSSANEPARAALITGEDPARDSSPSHPARLPVEITANEISAKRKRVDDVPAQRATRLKLSDDRAAEPSTKESETELAIGEHLPLASSDETRTPFSTTLRAHGKQNQNVYRPIQPAVPQAGPSRPQPTQPALKTRKPKPQPKPAATQQPPEITSSSKQAIKRENKRQPTGACKSCRTRHQKCDRMHPTCGRCAKVGTACEYPAQAPPNPSPKKTRAKQADLEDARDRSVTVSPPPRQKSPAKCPVPLPSKKPNVAAATAASSRAPRTKNTQGSRASPKKK